jgi:hypothetical protein
MRNRAGWEASLFVLLAFGGFAGGEEFDCFLDALEAGLRLFGALDPVGVFLFVGVGESGEGMGLGGRFGEGGLEVGGNCYGARGVVEGEFDLYGVACFCAGSGEDVFADAEDVDAGARHEGVAEGESVDGGANGDLAFAPEDFRDAEGDLEVGPRAAGAAANELGFELEGIGLGFGHECFLRRRSWNLIGL